jgi:glycopeptide antibiotics resistance protein
MLYISKFICGDKGGELMKTKRGKIIVWIIFIVYLLLLVKVILFKYPIVMIREILKGPKIPLSYRIASSNFMPLKSIFNFLFKGQSIRTSFKNILGNIVVFAPLGFLLPVLTDRKSKFKSIILSSFILSLMFEIIQLLTSLGEFDIDDILLNVFGASLGYLFLRIKYFSYKSR